MTGRYSIHVKRSGRWLNVAFSDDATMMIELATALKESFVRRCLHSADVAVYDGETKVWPLVER